jgi:hypothetical protein
MKLKQIGKSSTVAWSPIYEHRELLVAGTVSGSIDTDFDTSSSLELYSLSNVGCDDPPILLGSCTATERFNKIVWCNPFSTQSDYYSLGVVAGGHTNGAVSLWNPSVLLGQAESDNASAASALITTEKHHTKSVHSLAFNPCQVRNIPFMSCFLKKELLEQSVGNGIELGASHLGLAKDAKTDPRWFEGQFNHDCLE